VTYEEIASAVRVAAERAVDTATAADEQGLTAEHDVSVGDPADS
jgi:hypothetical protein